MTRNDRKIQQIPPRRATTVHDHPKKKENLILWVSPLQNDKGTKRIIHLLNNGLGCHRIADFDSRASHEIRFSYFFWVIVNGSDSPWGYLVYSWMVVGDHGLNEILDQHTISHGVTV